MTGLPLLALLRPLLLAAAALGLLGSGGVELPPRPAGLPAAAAPAGGVSEPAAPQGPRTDSPQTRAVVRAGLAPIASPSAGGPPAAPGSSTLVVPHLVDSPAAPPPAAPHLRAKHDLASGRAPPLTTGT